MNFVIDMSEVYLQQATFLSQQQEVQALRTPLGLPTPPPESALPGWAREAREPQ